MVQRRVFLLIFLLRLYGISYTYGMTARPRTVTYRIAKKPLAQQLKEETEKVSIGLLVRGYQRQLTYRKQDGSYAAFGERDSSGSMWLTAFVLSSFARAQSYIFIDENEIHSATDWIIRRQHEEGYFPTVGRVYNQDIQGGVNSEIALTAYVLGSLLDAQTSSPRKAF